MNYLVIALLLITSVLHATPKTNTIQRTPTMSRAYVTPTTPSNYTPSKSQTQERKTIKLDEDSSPSSWEQH